MTPEYTRLLEKGTQRIGECLVYRGPRGTPGYGIISIKKKHSAAHRVAYQEWFGQISPGLVVDHVCHNEAARNGLCRGGGSCIHRMCVNPAHLEAKTSGENFRASPLPAEWNRRGQYLTHCYRGHEFTPENTYNPPRGGSRACMECRRMNLRASRKRRRDRG